MIDSSITGLVAAEVMQRDMVTVGPRNTLSDALSLMTENHITGLPVVDERDKCIGLICASDILNYEDDHTEEAAEANSDLARHYDPDKQQWETVRVTSFALEEFGEVRVQEIMTPDLISVKADTPLPEVAQRMVDAGVHRMLVLDDKYRLYGIVSAFDFVKLLATS